MENIANDCVTSCYVDRNSTRGSGDLIIRVTVDPLCCILETSIRLYISDTSNKQIIKLSNHVEYPFYPLPQSVNQSINQSAINQNSNFEIVLLTVPSYTQATKLAGVQWNISLSSNLPQI